MIDLDISKAEAAFLSRDVAATCLEFVALFPGHPQLARIEALVRFAMGEPAPELATHLDFDSEARVFLQSIQKTNERLEASRNTQAREPPIAQRIQIGADLDFLGQMEGIEGWSICQCLNFLALQQLRPTRGAAVVGTMRDDGIYALEWIAHYQALGFEHIFIYTNDNSDGSEVLLRRLADQGIITLIESTTARKVAPEVKAYEHSIQLLTDLRHFAWVLYVDSDELFTPAPQYDNDVKNILAALAQRYPDRLPSAVCYVWRWYVSGMAFARTPGLLIERFQHATPHSLTKSLVRLQDAVSMRRDHFPDFKAGGFLVDSAFERLPQDTNLMWKKREPQYAGGCVNHYWPKSFEEFAIKKARGQTLDLETNLYDRPFSLFFEWNGHEVEENRFPIDARLLARVQEKVEALRRIDGVGVLADQISREFPKLIAHYYGDEGNLRALYDEHMRPPN